MADQPNPPKTNAHDEFIQLAQGPSSGLLREYLDLLRYNKKWWLAPIVIFLLLASIIVVLGGTTLAPLIYTLF